MNPTINELTFEYEYGLLVSERIPVPLLKQSIEIWINTEDNMLKKYSDKQASVLNHFLQIHPTVLHSIQLSLQTYAQELLLKGKVVKQSLLHSNSYDLAYTALLIPTQGKTDNEYLFLLAETKWKIPESEHNIELEILVKNNELEFLQEDSGLWTRNEWNEYYNNVAQQ